MFMCIPARLALAVVAFFSLSVLTLAQEAPPSADTFVSSAKPTLNNGSGPLLSVGPGTTTYLKFNLSGVPAGPSVSKATLRLFVGWGNHRRPVRCPQSAQQPHMVGGHANLQHAAAPAGHVGHRRTSHSGVHLQREQFRADRHHAHGAGLVVDHSLEQQRSGAGLDWNCGRLLVRQQGGSRQQP
jgi:hypothetical protein